MSTPPPECCAAAIDWGRLEALRDLQAPGEPDVVAQVIALFTREAADRLRGLAEGVEQEDRQALTRHAHRLRGSAGLVGAHGISDLAGRLEHAAAGADLAGLRADVEALQRALASVLDALRQYGGATT